MSPKDCLLAAIRLETPERIPTFEWFIDTAVALPLCGSGDPIEITERLDLDAVNLRADYQKKWTDEKNYIDEWGGTKHITDDILPASLGHPLADIAAQKNYEFPKVDSPERFKTLEKAVKRFGDTRGIVFNLRDGFSDMRDILGYENALMGMLLDKKNFVELLNRVVNYNLALAEIAVKRYGIQVIATTDDVCNAKGPLMSPKSYFDMVYPAFKRVIEGYRSLGLFVIKHCDGNVLPFLDAWIDAGISCLNPIDPGGGLDMGEMKKNYGSKIALMGNIDCTGNLCNGTEEQVAEEVRVCIQKGGPNGLILASSNTIHHGVKPENYRAMLQTLRNH
jgi:uroporphyrinogen decarboxylase